MPELCTRGVEDFASGNPLTGEDRFGLREIVGMPELCPRGIGDLASGDPLTTGLGFFKALFML